MKDEPLDQMLASPGVDTVESATETSTRMPHDKEHNVDPHPGTVVRYGDVVAYDEEGTLHHVEGIEGAAEEFMGWVQKEIEDNLNVEVQVAGYLEEPSRNRDSDSDSAYGEELYELACDQLDQDPLLKVEDREGYGQVVKP